jgi:Pectate lyase superfamily protein
MDKRIILGGSILLALACATGAKICAVVANRSATQVAARESSNYGAAPQSFLDRSSHVDVTAFGAKGDGAADDTAAIQAAIDFGCSHNGATVFFPPARRYYKVTQTQRGVSGTAPIFRVCKYFHASGGNSATAREQFSPSPQIAINAEPGASPNPAPIFDLGETEQSTLENLELNGYNEALATGTNTQLLNVTGNVNPTKIGTAEHPNTAVLIQGGIWIFWRGGMASSNSTTIPSITIINNKPQVPGIVHLEDLVSIGCMQAISVVNQIGTAGNWSFENVTEEDCASGYLVITDDGNPAHSWSTINGLSIYGNTGVSDATYPALVKISSAKGSHTVVSGLLLTNPSIAIPGNVPVVQLCNATALSVNVLGAPSGSALVEDCDGRISGNGVGQNRTGFDYYFDGSRDNERTDLQQPGGAGGALRVFAPGTSPQHSYAIVSIDPQNGYAFGSEGYGPDASFRESAPGTVDVRFANSYPPAKLVATATAGGALRPDKYSYFILSTEALNCEPAHTSAPSQPSNVVIIEGSNRAVNLKWTLPAEGASKVAGYCIFRQPGGGQSWNSSTQNQEVFVSGAETTNYTDKNFTGCCTLQAPVNQLRPVHRFTVTSLGVNTTNPQANLDVNGSLRVGGGSTIRRVLLRTAKLNFTAIAPQSCQEQPLELTGAETNAVAQVSPAASLGSINLFWSARVSAANTVSVRVCNPSAAALTPKSVEWNVEATQ